MRFRRSIRARNDGTVEVRLGAAERSLLAHVALQLADDLAQPDDPSLQRLFPPGYSEDPVRDAGYQILMGDELRQRHLGALTALVASADAERLDPAEAEAWLRSINAVRLVLGTRLGITSDDHPVQIDRDDPQIATWVAYDFLSTLLDDLINALSF